MFDDLCRDGVSDPGQQISDMQVDLAGKDKKISSLEAYIAGVMKDGISNNAVLKELHEALVAKDAAIAELQSYIDAELKHDSQSEEEQESFSAPPNGGLRLPSESVFDKAEPGSLSIGQTTLKISQLKAQIHRLESRLDSSSSESSSDEEEVRVNETSVQNSWWSAKADSLTADILRLQTEAAEAEERYTTTLQVIMHASFCTRHCESS